MPLCPLEIVVPIALSGCGGDGSSSASPEDCGEVDLTTALEHVMAAEATDCEVTAYERRLQGQLYEIGPQTTDIRVAWSGDGMTFGLLDDPIPAAFAGVPDVTRLDDGTYVLFWVDGDLERAMDLAWERSDWFSSHGLPGFGALRMATSADGLVFEEVDELAIEGLVQGLVVDPNLVEMPDGSWRLYYMATPVEQMLSAGDSDDGAQHDIYFAETEDLVRFSQVQAAVHGPFADPIVHCWSESDCTMLSFGLDESVSTDGGDTFDYLGEIEGFGGFAPDLLEIDDAQARVFYNAFNVGAPLISMHTADGGGSWEGDGGERLDVYGEAPTIAPAPDGGWYMYVHKFKPGYEPDFAKDR